MLEGLQVADLTAPGLLGITILLLLIGRIVPRATLRDKAEEALRWQAAYEAERTARALSDKQTGELLEVTKTTEALIRAVFTNSEHIRQSGESDVMVETT